MIHIAIATELANFVIGLIQALGYPGIFVLMLLEGLLLPIPSEVVMAFGGYLAFSGGLLGVAGLPAFIILLVVGSLGNLTGAYLACSRDWLWSHTNQSLPCISLYRGIMQHTSQG